VAGGPALIPRRLTATLTLGALALVAWVSACASLDQQIGAERRVNARALRMLAGEIADGNPDRFVIVQRGEIAAEGEDLAETLEEAAGHGVPDHRFVFRPSESGKSLHRLAFVPQGGRVVGRVLLDALGVSVKKHAGGAITLSRRGAQVRLEAGSGRLRVNLRTPDGRYHEEIDAWVDPKFDGPLLVDAAVAWGLRAERYEIPGGAEVEVPFGRPFLAHRSHVDVEFPDLRASGPSEILYKSVRMRGERTDTEKKAP